MIVAFALSAALIGDLDLTITRTREKRCGCVCVRQTKIVRQPGLRVFSRVHEHKPQFAKQETAPVPMKPVGFNLRSNVVKINLNKLASNVTSAVTTHEGSRRIDVSVAQVKAVISETFHELRVMCGAGECAWSEVLEAIERH